MDLRNMCKNCKQYMALLKEVLSFNEDYFLLVDEYDEITNQNWHELGRRIKNALLDKNCPFLSDKISPAFELACHIPCTCDVPAGQPHQQNCHYSYYNLDGSDWLQKLLTCDICLVRIPGQFGWDVVVESQIVAKNVKTDFAKFLEQLPAILRKLTK